MRGIAAPVFQATKLAAALSLVVDVSVCPAMVAQWRDEVMTAARGLSETLEMAVLPIAR